MFKRQLDGDRIFVIEHFFSTDECDRMLALAEAAGFDEAPIDTFGGPVVNKEMRNNVRVMIDDPVCAAHLWPRLRPFVPRQVGYWQPIGLNERFRYYRYDVAEKFAPHFDGCFRRDVGEESRLTFMVYLNDGFDGGETIFRQLAQPLVVKPARGMALVFLHRQLHQGSPVISGRKYVLRSDVMCRYRPREARLQLGEDVEAIAGLESYGRR